jgi:hypothetical protein
MQKKAVLVTSGIVVIGAKRGGSWWPGCASALGALLGRWE